MSDQEPIVDDLGNRRITERRRGARTMKSFEHWAVRRFRLFKIAFFMLAAMNAAAFYWLVDSRTVARSANAERQTDIRRLFVQVQQGREDVILKICAIDNRQNASIRKMLDRLQVDPSDFQAISCRGVVKSANTTAKLPTP